jgi:hypothetical protein
VAPKGERELAASGELAAGQSQGTKPCRFCRSPMPQDAKFCTTCQKFQSIRDRLTDGVSIPSLLQVLTTTLPLIAIVFVFVQERIVFPFSEVTAVPVQCQFESVTLGLTNAGNRPAIVKGGRLLLTPVAGDRIERDLIVPADRNMVLEPGKSDVRTFSITTLDDTDVGPIPPPEPGAKCFYEITLATSEFGDEMRPPKKVSCACPARQ